MRQRGSRLIGRRGPRDLLSLSLGCFLQPPVKLLWECENEFEFGVGFVKEFGADAGDRSIDEFELG